MASISTHSEKVARAVESNPRRLGGELVFAGTRVPVRSLFVYLRKSIPLEQFLDDFEGVTKEQVDAVLEMAESSILNKVGRA
jgi:uncharacterized protein (DUF433 family)